MVHKAIIWSVPRPVPPSEHGFKYRLVFVRYGVRDGVRVVGYDNERGKGDHRHLGDIQVQGVSKLLEDFMRDVEASK